METIPSNQLKQWAQNAACTSLSAGGHGKAERNEATFNKYKAELENRGYDVDIKNYAKAGQFNGPGSV